MEEKNWIRIRVSAACEHLDTITAIMSMIDNALMIEDFSDVEKEFEKVQMITHCSTGCGGCHDKVLDVLSELMA